MTLNKFLRAAAYGILALAMNSCIFPFDTDYTGQTGDLPLVVEGDILIGGATTIRLDRVWPFKELEDEERERFSLRYVDAYIEGEDGTRVERQYYDYHDFPYYDYTSYFSSSSYSYYHYIGSPTATLYFDTRNLRPDQRYRLVMTIGADHEHAGETYESDWMKVNPAPVVDGLSFSANIPNEELEIGLSMHCNGAHHFRWTFEEDWKYHSEINTFYMFDPETEYVRHFDDYATQNIYYCWGHDNSTEIMTFSTAFQKDDRFEDLDFYSVSLKDLRLQMLYRIRVHLSALSEDAYDYWENIRQNSEGQGSLFAPIPSQLPGNIRCTSNPSALVIGYVDACQESIGELYYDNNVHHHFIPAPPTQFEPVEVDNYTYANAEWFYNHRYLPYQAVYNPWSEPTYLWAPASCVDCERLGGSKEKPEDWPND